MRIWYCRDMQRLLGHFLAEGLAFRRMLLQYEKNELKRVGMLSNKKWTWTKCSHLAFVGLSVLQCRSQLITNVASEDIVFLKGCVLLRLQLPVLLPLVGEVLASSIFFYVARL